MLTCCNSCLQPFEIIVNPDEARLLRGMLDDRNQVACPRLCGGKVLFHSTKDKSVIAAISSDPRLRDPMRLTGTELWKAVNGGGLPDEIPTDIDVVDALLRANPITSLTMEKKNGHVYLHELKLANGATVHLTGGQYGAQVLKITRKAST